MRHVRLVLLVAVAVVAGCGGDDDGASCSTPGGPASGATDSHCGATIQPTSQDACNLVVPDAGPSDPDASTAPELGDTMYGTEGDDDDCKYHVTWSSTAICRDQGVTFTVNATRKDGDAPATGADPYIEAFLDPTHPAPNSGATTSEKGDGSYEIGPMKFDQPGRWTIRFHFYATCNDAEESPHGHAAFYLDVP